VTMPVPTADSVIRAMYIKGFVMPVLLAPAVLTDEAGARTVLDALVAEGLVGPKGPMFQLTDAGKARGAALVVADQEQWGVDNAIRALDAFLEYDHRMKEVVTAWQLRTVNGQQTMNDHTDARYDAGVLADLATLAAEAGAWLAPLREQLPRLGDYSARLDGAAARVAAGEHAFIASPRVDSYHSIWFELHEDLIRLAGRTRESEVAAGRA
jgi:hypothetical protein